MCQAGSRWRPNREIAWHTERLILHVRYTNSKRSPSSNAIIIIIIIIIIVIIIIKKSSPEDTFLRDSARPRPCRPKSVYEANKAQAFWDVPLFAEHQEVAVCRANRVDARIINHESKRVITLEMSCPWVTNWEKKEEKKTTKYGPLRWKLKGLCQLESMRSEVMQITFNCQNSIVFNA